MKIVFIVLLGLSRLLRSKVKKSKKSQEHLNNRIKSKYRKLSLKTGKSKKTHSLDDDSHPRNIRIDEALSSNISSFSKFSKNSDQINR